MSELLISSRAFIELIEVKLDKIIALMNKY